MLQELGRFYGDRDREILGIVKLHPVPLVAERADSRYDLLHAAPFESANTRWRRYERYCHEPPPSRLERLQRAQHSAAAGPPRHWIEELELRIVPERLDFACAAT
jgi:hypothetical protein